MYIWFPSLDSIDVTVNNPFDTSDCPPRPPSKILEWLIAAEKEIEDLKKKSDILTLLHGRQHNQATPNQLNTKQQQKGVHMKRTMAAARGLTFGDGSMLLEKHCEEEQLKEVKQVEDVAQKYDEDEAHCKLQANITHKFSGPLNKSK